MLPAIYFISADTHHTGIFTHTCTNSWRKQLVEEMGQVCVLPGDQLGGEAERVPWVPILVSHFLTL